MFPSFTGTARQKRQVNLSGRNNNPFAPSPTSKASTTAQNTLAQVQQERQQRQRERERPPAALRIQRSWRGYRSRRSIQDQWRKEWDSREGWPQNVESGPYSSTEACLGQMRLLLHFYRCEAEDIQRLRHFAGRYLLSASAVSINTEASRWAALLSRLADIVLTTLIRPFATSQTEEVDITHVLLQLLQALAHTIPGSLASRSERYYKTLASLLKGRCHDRPNILEGPIFELLIHNDVTTVQAYRGFCSQLLTVPDLPRIFRGLEKFDIRIDYHALAYSLEENLTGSLGSAFLHSRTHECLLWLLAYFIHFHGVATEQSGSTKSAPDARFVRIVSNLVSYLAEDIVGRVDTPASSIASFDNVNRNGTAAQSIPDFVSFELSKLVNEANVSGLLTSLEIDRHGVRSNASAAGDASALASYALMLLRIFPRQGDEIRMLLYRSSTSARGMTLGEQLPAVKYFFAAARSTPVFQDIKRTPDAAMRLLKQTPLGSASTTAKGSDQSQEWRTVLLFLELYTVPLRIMDDEEFLSGADFAQPSVGNKQSALTIESVKELTIFLKNLAFSLYWHASELLTDAQHESAPSLAEYFGRADSSQPRVHNNAQPNVTSIAGIGGITSEYLKGLVTGILRMMYERDSRRGFLPRDHWLMTKYFEMDRFITAVVKEEEEKHQIERSYDDSALVAAPDDDSDGDEDDAVIGHSHAQQVRNAERRKRRQQKASRRKYLQSVTPRLEILQNMPFFIPFRTRVEIFRAFVAMDQVTRRGTSDPDEWRFAQINSPTGAISRHRARVRRKNIFDDAYEQFYELGDGLKEPIQIRFVDEFDTVEEGIDGGGVTKEFLTSITSEAFGADDGLESLFVENDQHLLYPNPTSVEDRMEALRRALYREGSPEWNENVRDLRRRYEFLGRIVGKCLYEGILVDLHFAPFFLLKWALTGGSGSAAKESGYRASINDLRDLDQGLYQGLLQLKNYTGNVEDFALDFTVTDDLHVSPTETVTVTRELRHNGAATSVTNANRLLYISDIARYRLQGQPQRQTSAFLQGLGTIVSPSWLSMFNQSELQTLVSGTSQEVNVSDLRANTQYGGLYVIGDDGMEHPSIQLFWKVMQNLDDADRKKVLKFVTSTPRAPLLGFKNLNPRFSIRDSGSDQTRLPSTSTCVNLLKLPIYQDEKTLRERLLYSVNSGAGFNLS